jgi:hypothetical protein
MGSVANEVLFDLNDKWRLGFDELQWIVMKKRIKYGKTVYRPLSFIASRKLVLMRVLDELDVTPSDSANAHLARLPDSFRTFMAAEEGVNQHD